MPMSRACNSILSCVDTSRWFAEVPEQCVRKTFEQLLHSHNNENMSIHASEYPCTPRMLCAWPRARCPSPHQGPSHQETPQCAFLFPLPHTNNHQADKEGKHIWNYITCVYRNHVHAGAGTGIARGYATAYCGHLMHSRETDRLFFS